MFNILRVSKVFLSFLFISNLFNLIESHDIKVSCKNEDGQNVDWFYLYKLPAVYNTGGAKRVPNSGLSYIYLTDTDYDQWTLSNSSINESSSIPALTLEPLFADPSVLLLAYNDEFPDGQVFPTGGHTKGVIATDGNTGIWLIHSVPKFPSIPKYEYPATGKHYGQSFLCITLNATELEKIGELQLFNEPNIYFNRLPETLSGKFPHLEQAVQKQWINAAPYYKVLDIKSLHGTYFKSFAKSSAYKQELYEDLVAPTLPANLLVETWRNGGHNFQSNCSLPEKLFNVEAIKIQTLDIGFRTTHDHSKWAVSKCFGLLYRSCLRPSNWICVGDINRQQHQLVRGGGVVCQSHKAIARHYSKLVEKFEPCPAFWKKETIFT